MATENKILTAEQELKLRQHIDECRRHPSEN